MTIQVDRSHYFRRSYDTKARWISYWHQIDEVIGSQPAHCLEIGIGNGFVRDQLRARGVKLTTVDIDPALAPDRQGDVRELPCEAGEFDVVLCAEVLEHLPFGEVPTAVAEIARVCRRAAVVSVPQFGRYFRLAFRIPPFPAFSRVGHLPSRHRFEFDGQHHWEMGARNSPDHVVRDTLQRGFGIERDYVVPENPYHRFFVLERST
jgi:hypothetical protein